MNSNIKKIKKDLGTKIKDINFVQDFSIGAVVTINRKFESYSKIDWSPIKNYNVDSSTFRRRFATRFLMNFYNNLETYVDNYKKATGDDMDYELLSKCIDKFHYESIYGVDMHRSFIYLNNIMNYSYTKDYNEQNKINDSLWNYIVGESFSDEEIPLIFVIASRLATNSTYKDNLPSIDYFDDKYINSNYDAALTMLGININNAGSISESFEDYCLSRPKIKVHKSVSKSSDTMLGITALSFLQYIHNNSDMANIIDKIIKNVRYSETIYDYDMKDDCLLLV